jgi:disulfide oxidoreductase YuzD
MTKNEPIKLPTIMLSYILMIVLSLFLLVLLTFTTVRLHKTTDMLVSQKEAYNDMMNLSISLSRQVISLENENTQLQKDLIDIQRDYFYFKDLQICNLIIADDNTFPEKTINDRFISQGKEMPYNFIGIDRVILDNFDYKGNNFFDRPKINNSYYIMCDW